MDRLAESGDEIAVAAGFSGVARVDRPGGSSFAAAYGLAHRGHCIANTVATRFGIASGTKGLTALTVMTLVELRPTRAGTTARSVLGDDLPLIDDRVTVEQLLSHRSGIGDYLDETDIAGPTDYPTITPSDWCERHRRELAGWDNALYGTTRQSRPAPVALYGVRLDKATLGTGRTRCRGN